MQQLIPENQVSQIFKLNLSIKLIADGRVAFPIWVKGKIATGTYKVLIHCGSDTLSKYNNFALDLKGNIDIEYLKYSARVTLSRIPDEPDYYRMQISKFYKINDREFRRVPYSRMVKLTFPIECEAQLVNLSGSGAMLYCMEKLEGSTLVMSFTLLKKELILQANIVEQIFLKDKKLYRIRCHFDPIDSKTQNIIATAVKEITLKAKERLRNQPDKK